MNNLEFNGNLGTYKLIKTDDGSPTLFSSHFDEACHSLSGAEGETYYNFIEGCDLKNLVKKHSPLNILEVGFGTGMGFKVTRNYMQENFPEAIFNFVSLEIDPALVEWSGLLAPNLKVLIGDARETLKDYQGGPFHAIFQDPFSPKKNPTLWSVEWFECLKGLSHPDVVLSTYSASSSVRKALMEAGWVVEERVGFGGKRASSRAFLKGKMTEELIRKLSSDKIKPVRD
jgi:tRNA U34 5-methylaminomethyl-2-thiouridine-forming methyltransferase MnmC